MGTGGISFLRIDIYLLFHYGKCYKKKCYIRKINIWLTGLETLQENRIYNLHNIDHSL